MFPDKPYLIGETAYHHEGDMKFLMEVVDAAAEIGLDAIKFHLLIDPEDYLVADHPVMNTIKKWLFSEKQWDTVFSYASERNLEIILLCNDVASFNVVEKTKSTIKAVEIHASGLNDIFLLEKAKDFDGTVILGIGGSTLDEIQYAVEYLNANNKTDILLMYGFQAFPTCFADINLSRMNHIKELFGLPMGYADHTDPNDEDMPLVSVLPALQGVYVFEKHLTIAPGQRRTDYQAACSIEQIAEIKRLLIKLSEINGKGSLELSAAEKDYGNTGPMKKALVARKNIQKGEELNLRNIAFRRTESSSSLRQNQLAMLLGSCASRNIVKDEILDFSNVEYKFRKTNFDEFKMGEK